MNHLRGDIFNSDANLTLHQVNCRGVMGSGVAKQVREKYPEVYKQYKDKCNRYRNSPRALLGSYQAVWVYSDSGSTKRAICNVFSQDGFGTDGKRYTDYSAMEHALTLINRDFAGATIAIPYLMGCGLGGGDWSVVSQIIDKTLVDCNVTCYEL